MKTLPSLAATALFGVVLSEAASAQSVRSYPECRSFQNRHSCNCALANGGSVSENPYRPGRLRWQAARPGTSAHMAFMACAQSGGQF